MRIPLVAGNWKMNGDTASIKVLVDNMLEEFGSSDLRHCEVLVCPSFAYLRHVAELVDGQNIGVAGQDVDARQDGAVTGAVSAAMLKDVGCRLVIVGHSERRTLFSDSDELVATKFEQCLAHELIPILCVGETLEERESGKTLEVVTRQLGAVTERVGSKGFSNALLAYEPVWAIGTGKSATPEQAEEVHLSLRQFLAGVDEGISTSTRILYGGSVTSENAASLFEKENIDGALVGGHHPGRPDVPRHPVLRVHPPRARRHHLHHEHL